MDLIRKERNEEGGEQEEERNTDIEQIRGWTLFLLSLWNPENTSEERLQITPGLGKQESLKCFGVVH